MAATPPDPGDDYLPGIDPDLDRAIFDRHRVQVEGSFATMLGIPMLGAILGALVLAGLAHEWLAVGLIVVGGLGASFIGSFALLIRVAAAVLLVVHDQRLTAGLLAANVLLVLARNALGVRHAKTLGLDLDV